MSLSVYFTALGVILIIAVSTWLLSVIKRDVSIVDSIWSMMILVGGLVYFYFNEQQNLRNIIILCLLFTWALRLATYLTWRNWGESEDRRYQVIRKKYSPNFALKSLGIIFIFQAVLAWIISLPLWPTLNSPVSLQPVDFLAITLWLVGMSFETIADWQLARFKTDPRNQGKVMNQGLWHYSRHPNYFGEALVWWGFYMFAVSSGAWWTFPAPLLMTWLLLKFSGVVMLEETIVERRPDYQLYIEETNAFIPGPHRTNRQIVSGG